MIGKISYHFEENSQEILIALSDVIFNPSLNDRNFSKVSSSEVVSSMYENEI